MKENKRIKILNFIPYGKYGGPQKRAIAIATHLRESNVETFVVSRGYDDGIFERRLIENNIPYMFKDFALLQRKPFSPIKYVLRFPIDAFRFWKIIRMYKPDVIHANGIINLLPVIVGWLLNIPVVWHMNDMMTPKVLVTILAKLMRNRNIFVVVAAEAVANHYLLTQKRIPFNLLPPPLPENSKTISNQSLAKLNIEPGAIVVGYLSSLLISKGCIDFLKAFAQIKEQVPNAVAVIVGSEVGSKIKDFTEINNFVKSLSCQNSIYFVGYQEDVEHWYKMFDVFLFLSHSEACPVTVLQAMQVGRPIVSTEVGDVTRIIGAIPIPTTKVSDIDAIVNRSLEMIDLSEIDRANLAVQMQDQVSSLFNVSYISKLYFDVYSKAISS